MTIDQTLIRLIQDHLAIVSEDAPPAIDADTSLFGDKGFLDSLALVTLIVGLEQGIQHQFDKTITIASEKAMSRKQSPFLTVGSLVQFIKELLAEAQNV